MANECQDYTPQKMSFGVQSYCTFSGSVRLDARLPNYESQRTDVWAIAVFKVVAIDAYNLLTHLHMDGGKWAITTLRTDSLNSSLVLVEVNVWDHVSEFDASNYVIASIMPVLMIIERVHTQNNRGNLFVDRRWKEGTLGVMGHQFNGSYDTQRVLLIPDFF